MSQVLGIGILKPLSLCPRGRDREKGARLCVDHRLDQWIGVERDRSWIDALET